MVQYLFIRKITFAPYIISKLSLLLKTKKSECGLKMFPKGFICGRSSCCYAVPDGRMRNISFIKKLRFGGKKETNNGHCQKKRGGG